MAHATILLPDTAESAGYLTPRAARE